MAIEKTFIDYRGYKLYASQPRKVGNPVEWFVYDADGSKRLTAKGHASQELAQAHVDTLVGQAPAPAPVPTPEVAPTVEAAPTPEVAPAAEASVAENAPADPAPAADNAPAAEAAPASAPSIVPAVPLTPTSVPISEIVVKLTGSVTGEYRGAPKSLVDMFPTQLGGKKKMQVRLGDDLLSQNVVFAQNATLKTVAHATHG